MTVTINAVSGTGVVTTSDGSGIVKLQSNSVTTNALAWVNFNGTGTVAIRSSYNVSSITDNGSGDYTINFANALSDANYCVLCNSVLASTTSATGSAGPYGTFAAGASTKTTSAIRTLFGNSSTGNGTDTAEANVIVFGN